MNATPFFFSFRGIDDLQLHCQDITNTTPYSCGRRKFSLACSHAQRPLRNLQSLLLRLIQPVPLQIICCHKQVFSPDLLRLIGLMFNKKYAERKYTLSFFMRIHFIRIPRLKFAKWVVPEKIHTPPPPDGWDSGNSRRRGG